MSRAVRTPALAALALALALVACPPASEPVAPAPVPSVSAAPIVVPLADPSPSAPPEVPTVVAPVPVPEPDDPAFAALRDTKAQAPFRQRARLARFGKLRLVAGGEPVADGGGKPADLPEPLVVVADGGAEVRLVLRRSGLGLLAWVERADLGRWPRRPVLLTAQPVAPPPEPDAPGVWLAPGARLELLEERNGFARVRLDDDEGWVESAALDPVVEPKEFGVGMTHELAAGATLFRGRGTGALVRVDDTAWVEALGEPDRSFTKVAYVVPCHGWRRVVGYVASFQLRALEGGAGYGCGHGGLGEGREVPSTVGLAAGQVLRSTADGPRVGLALRDLAAVDEGPVGVGRSVLTRTAWGMARFYAEPLAPPSAARPEGP
ncbi:MAG: hypothetical protein IT373_33165 [Polyangiaceae bacterium]|nr:hypothetical protein [Polyangiaceae bacterium]